MSLEIICIVANVGVNRKNTYGVRDYCRSHGLSFATRIFEPMVYDVDNKLISSVPGFHLYKNGVYQRSFGLEDNIEDVLARYDGGWCAWLKGFCCRYVEKSRRNKV